MDIQVQPPDVHSDAFAPGHPDVDLLYHSNVANQGTDRYVADKWGDNAGVFTNEPVGEMPKEIPLLAADQHVGEVHNVGIAVQLPEVEHLGPRQWHPLVRHGDWIYPINQNSYACTTTIPTIPDDPQTF
jgi:hypothetical protein